MYLVNNRLNLIWDYRWFVSKPTFPLSLLSGMKGGMSSKKNKRKVFAAKCLYLARNFENLPQIQLPTFRKKKIFAKIGTDFARNFGSPWFRDLIISNFSYGACFRLNARTYQNLCSARQNRSTARRFETVCAAAELRGIGVARGGARWPVSPRLKCHQWQKCDSKSLLFL